MDGIDNLLRRCVGVAAGERVLLVCEPEGEDFYEPGIGSRVADRVEALGATPRIEVAPLFSDPAEFPPSLASAMNGVEHTVFLSRIGDYCRFATLETRSTKTICYARNTSQFRSDYACFDHGLMETLLARFESEIRAAGHWRIRCDHGTDIEGEFCWPDQTAGPPDDFTMRLFPVTTFIPVPCHNARGRVALTRWLVPGGGSKVDRHTLRFGDVVTARVEDGAIQGFRGPAAQRVVRHYARIADALEVNRDRVHSWHAGFNPGTAFTDDPESRLEEWVAVSFGSPRYLHFHTCGDRAPAELTWPVFNPTLEIDGEPWLADGRLLWLQRDDNRDLVREMAPDPVQASRLLGPSAPIGI